MLSNSIVALISPMKQGEIDFEAFEKLLNWHLEKGTSGIVLCGSTGEGHLLTADERSQMIKKAKEILADKISLIVGCGHFTYEGTKALVEQAEGCDAVLVTPPPYIKPSQQGIIDFFEKLHNETSQKIILYNNPSRCSVNLELSTVETLFKLPNIVGIKDSNTDLSRIVRLERYKNDKALLCGEDSMLFSYLLHGGTGAISVCGNIVPDALARVFKEGSVEGIQNHMRKLLPIIETLGIESNPSAIKYLMSIERLCENELRFPLRPISEITEAKLASVWNDYQNNCR